jgi:flagellar motor switch protein FliG
MSILCIGLLMQSQAHAQFREEMGTLETMYEGRARAVLNTVLRPFEYSVVVAVDIERDEARLSKIQEEYGKNFLPGMPEAGSLETMPVSNQLYDLKNRVDIHLILATTIPKEKEETLKALLKIKLHLDEQNGDSLTVARTTFPTLKEEPPADKLPEFSWKMWSLILILALLVLAGLLLYLYKRQNQKQEETKEKPFEEKATDLEAGKAEKPATTDLALEIDPSELLYEQKKQLLSFTSQYPEATLRALTDYFQKGHEQDILLMCESFGWELSKKLFSGFSARIWGKMGHMLITREKVPSTAEFQKALQNCYRIVLARYLEMGEQDQTDAFGFVWKLSANDRRKLLEGESAFNLALMCVNADRDQMGELLNSISEDLQEAVTIQIARLHVVPQESIRNSSELLTKKLKTIQEHPEVRLDGSSLAADLLRSLSPEKELQLFEKLRFENPADAERVRRTYLLYPDMVHVPAELITEMGAMLDVNIFANALRSGYPEVKQYILKCLPPKRSKMVERDLELEMLHFTSKDAAKAQREISKLAMSLLMAKGLSLDQLLPRTDSLDETKLGASVA